MEGRFGRNRATGAIRINVASGVLALPQRPRQELKSRKSFRTSTIVISLPLASRLGAIDVPRPVGAAIYGTASSGKYASWMQRGLHMAVEYRTKN